MQRRNISFLACVFSGLFCGTNYVFSTWGPQLRCHLSALAINLVGICGNLGVYIIGPISGHLVDRTGQRIPLILAGLTLFIGYYGLHVAYTRAWQHAAPILCILSFLTGIGSSLGNSAILNACAKSYPHNRGSATAFPIAAYGLSAFVFSRISYNLFPGDTGTFLLVLALSCGLSLTICAFLIGVYLPVSQQDYHARKSSESDSSETRRLLAGGRQDDQASIGNIEDTEVLAEVTGLELFRNRDFHLLLFTLALLSGSGLMYINNVGNNLTALFRAEHMKEIAAHEFPQQQLEALQALNVSLLSIFNCSGRIFAGITSDLLKHRIGLERSAFMLFSALLFMLAMALIYFNDASKAVAQYTALLGFTYGNMFGIAPVLTSELFGLRSFSTNWGFLSTAPGVAGNIMNLLYGKIYDSHSDPETHECSVGLSCFRNAFIIAFVACVIATVSATGLLLRHRTESRHKRQELR